MKIPSIRKWFHLMILKSLASKLIPIFYFYFPRMAHWGFRFRKANYENEMQLLNLLCDQNKTSLDIGAKVGMYTYRLLKHSKKVIAFEPHPLMAHILKNSFSPLVAIETLAISDQSGFSTLRIPFCPFGFPRYGRSTIEKENNLSFEGLKDFHEVKIETKCLDDYDFENIGFVKIDVEGHELAVLNGAKDLIQKCQPIFLIEANDHHCPGSVQELEDFFKNLKYLGLFLENQSMKPIGQYNHDFHFTKKGITNFIFLPKGDEFKLTNVPFRLRNNYLI